MKDVKIYIIVALLVLSFLQYAYPETANIIVEPVWGRVKSSLGQTPISKPTEFTVTNNDSLIINLTAI